MAVRFRPVLKEFRNVELRYRLRPVSRPRSRDTFGGMTAGDPLDQGPPTEREAFGCTFGPLVTRGGRRVPQFSGTFDPKDLDDEASPVELRVYEGTREVTDATFWRFRGNVFRADPDLSAEDVAALALETANRRRLKIEKAHALMAMSRELDAGAKRKPIPQPVRVAVWQRDGGRCVDCQSNEDLEFDHIIPLALGGSNTARNLQLLCSTCNRRKGATLG